MKFRMIAAIFFSFAIFCMGARAFSADDSLSKYPDDYISVKAGVYYPSQNYDIENFNGGSTTHLDSKTGFAGEVALGHYFFPYLAAELSAGYFESKGLAAAQPGATKFKVVPVVLTGKVLVPVGPIEPYGEFGIGAYISELNVSGNTGNFSGSTRITYGLHAGAGLNINLSSNVFIGVEGKYLWAKPSFGGQDVRLDGFIATGVLGFRF